MADQPDLSDEVLAGELRRERAMAAASGVPARTATQRPTGKGTRPTGKRRR
jgi:preprotein translocase subunit SecF